MTILSILKRVPIFNNIKDADLRKIEDILLERTFKKNEHVFYEAEEGDEFCIVGDGRIKIYKMSNEGQIKALAYLQRGDFFGEMALLNRSPRSASSMAVEDTTLYVVKQADFRKFLLKHPEILLTIVETISKRLRTADVEIEMFSFKHVKHRLITCLINLAEENGEDSKKGIVLPKEFTHQDISEMVGTAREVVTRLLLALKKEGLLDTKDRSIIIPSVEALKEKLAE